MGTIEMNVRDYTEKDQFDIIMMNPPFGGSELDIIKNNFPTDFTKQRIAWFIMVAIMHRLKEDGRAGVWFFQMDFIW